MKSLIEAYQLTRADIFPDDRSSGFANKTEKVPAKYRDPSSGKTQCTWHSTQMASGDLRHLGALNACRVGRPPRRGTATAGGSIERLTPVTVFAARR